MAKIPGTNVASTIAPFTTDDQFPTHDAIYGKGGQREVATIAERDAIPSARLTEGCTCYVAATEKTYRWKSNAWVDDTPQGGSDGKSAYQLYCDTVPEGEEPMSEQEWLASLKGEDGQPGGDGKSAYQVYLDTVPSGETPMTEAQWLASLKGQQGEQGPKGDTVVLDPDNVASYNLYGVPGSNTDGAMTQKAVTQELVVETQPFTDSFRNYDLTVDEGYINTSGGLSSTSIKGWIYTDFIKLPVGTIITYHDFSNNASVLGISFYDANKDYIPNSGIQGVNGTATMPEGAVYVRFCTGKSSSSSDATWASVRNVMIKERMQSLETTIQDVANSVNSKADSFVFVKPITYGDASQDFTPQYYYGSLYKDVFEEDRYVTRIKTHVPYTGTGYIVIGTPDNVSNPSSCTITSVHPIEMSGLETDLTSYGILVPAGSCVGIVGISNVIGIKGSSGRPSQTWFMNGIPSVGSTYSTTWSYSCNAEIDLCVKALLTDYVQEITESVGDMEEDIDSVSIENAECVICEGSSYTEGVCHPVGFSWTEKLNSVIDIPVVNDGVSGSTRAASLNNIKNGASLKNTTSVNNLSLPIRWAFCGNTANSDYAGDSFYDQLKQIEYYAEARGIEMLIGEEERGQLADCDPLLSSFASQEKIKASDNLNKIGPMLNPHDPNGNPDIAYRGLKYSGHNGWRMVACYATHYDFFKSLPIKHTLKLYRPRPTLIVNSVSDLFYTDTKEREKRWYAIGSGQNGSSSSPKIGVETSDNLDGISSSNQTTVNDVTPYSYSGTRESETALLLTGSAVPFSMYALIEFILDLRKISKATITFECSVEPTSVYVSGRDEWSTLGFDYDSENGLVTINANSSNLFLKKDKISILVAYNGSFTIAKPTCRATGSRKVLADWSFQRRKYGTELLSQTDITDWEGGTQITLPNNLRLYSAYNNVDKLLSLSDNTTTATKSFTTTDDVKDVAIRIVAQNFFKIMTKRFDENGVLPSEYSNYVNNSGVSLVNWQYDKGQLVLVVDGLYVFKFDVESGNCELYCEIHGLKPGNHTLSIRRDNDVNVNTPIFVHDVSVQKIG